VLSPVKDKTDGRSLRKKGIFQILVICAYAVELSLLLAFDGGMHLFGLTTLSTSPLTHVEILLNRPLLSLKNQLQQYRWILARKNTGIPGTFPTIGNLLAIARTLVGNLYESKESLLLGASRYGWTSTTFAVSEGSIVPTSAPREILYRILCNTTRVTDSLLTRGARRTLQNLRELVQVRRQTPAINPARYLNLRRIANGTPSMFFVCAHETGQFQDRYALYLGASQSDWGGFNAIKVIRRADRDWKMQNYA
jgi:hypothetical protein